jgi:hypothetical protein
MGDLYSSSDGENEDDSIVIGASQEDLFQGGHSAALPPKRPSLQLLRQQSATFAAAVAGKQPMTDGDVLANPALGIRIGNEVCPFFFFFLWSPMCARPSVSVVQPLFHDRVPSPCPLAFVSLFLFPPLSLFLAVS